MILGLGARAGIPAAGLAGALSAVLAEAGIGAAAVTAVATLDRRAAEPGVRAFAAARGWRLIGFTAGELARVPVPNPSAAVRDAIGAPGVAEAAALLAAGPGARLVLPKTRSGPVTVALVVAYPEMGVDNGVEVDC
ncbi:cobalamin biosynthesis protein [Actinoplanes sp. NPDC051851]|uniref:cobalamin biosynthesis protein n=1 Tax=Actinoplanes sp. NPDC051851 TaxID=3154753 RepID=UPI0034222CA7